MGCGQRDSVVSPLIVGIHEANLSRTKVNPTIVEPLLDLVAQRLIDWRIQLDELSLKALPQHGINLLSPLVGIASRIVRRQLLADVGDRKTIFEIHTADLVYEPISFCHG